MRTRSLLLALACSLAAACGGDEAGPVDSGLPAEKKVSELTPSEQETLCRAAAENLASQVSASDAKRAACIAIGASLGGDDPVASCEGFVPMCLDAPDDGDNGGTDTCMLSFDATTCTAPVSEVEACLSERNEATGAALRELSCDDLVKEPVDPVTGPACTKIKTTCPGA